MIVRGLAAALALALVVVNGLPYRLRLRDEDLRRLARGIAAGGAQEMQRFLPEAELFTQRRIHDSNA